MFDVKKVSLDWGGRLLTLETGRMARQADGAVLATYGETSVLTAVVFDKTLNPAARFFPLTVNYREKYYASGRIPGGYFKREGRPTEKETLTSRLIDRPIRPLFAKGFKNEIQVTATVLSHDLDNDPDIVALIASSASLAISGVPFLGPLGAARVGYRDGEYVINPTGTQLDTSDLDLVVAGTSDAVMMVESQANELSEDIMLGAVMTGHASFQPVIDSIIDLAEQAAREPYQFLPVDTPGLDDHVQTLAGDNFRAAYAIADKTARQDAVARARSNVKENIRSDDRFANLDDALLDDAMKSLEANIVRSSVLASGKRIDGRALDQVRPIQCDVSVLPRTHGSALFTRGTTQALAVATLGTAEDEQFVDRLEGTIKERFLLHYNFPPFSVGETGRSMGPGRREIGHGKLAWRALHAVLPDAETFPYTLRLVSEIMESDGSSSMATVCASSLALMDAGVPVNKPVSGIAMGLIKSDSDIAILSDILGDEDHLGDMDFKVAGTTDGITSLQMDIKIAGITRDIMDQALGQARAGRLHILDEMKKALDTSRETVSDNAPQITSMTIPVDKIRDVIGTGGKIIRQIVEETGAKINIEDDGTVTIAAVDSSAINAAHQRIHALTAEPDVGAIYTGKVVKVMDFGAFVNFFGARDGLVHISQLANRRVRQTSDVVSEGDEVKVKLLGVDQRGKVRLSMKVVDQTTGEDISDENPEPS